jgi:pimeloyl-ACP methyl ester carboxylesterase
MWDNHIAFSKRIESSQLIYHGETECLGYVHSMEDNADAVHAVLRIGIRKSILVGHSMGGYVVWLRRIVS